tara:strand:+ start:135 stop:410 length:276 start_codon:yes stop_codon:yes gene_type:complete
LSEIERIEQWHSEEMAKGYSQKDINYTKAGYDEIVSEYGYFYTLFDLAKGDLSKYDDILKRKVVEVYRSQQLKSRINKSEALYHNLKQGKL